MREVGDKRLNSVVNFATVGTAAAAARVAVNPFSVMKIWAEAGIPGGKNGSMQTIGWVIHQHGMLKGFSRGAIVAAARAFPHYGITFAVYDRVSSAYVNKPKGTPTMESLVATYLSGAVGGTVATLVTHPLDVVKTRLVVQPGLPAAHYSGAVNAFTKIAQEGIFSGIYRGLGVSVVGAATFWGMGFVCWEIVDQIPWTKKRPFVPFEWFLWPCAAVGVATVAAHPFDVIRRKAMTQSSVLPREGGVDIRFKNLFELVTGIWKANGVFGFYQGLVANSMKIVPQLAVFWVLFKGSQTFTAGAPTSNTA